MRTFLCLGFTLALLALSSCAYTGTHSLQELLEHPGDFSNEDVIIKGKYAEAIKFLPGPDGEVLYIYLIDEQGYKIRIKCDEGNREFIIGEIYYSTGRITTDETCVCQSKNLFGDWTDFYTQLESICDGKGEDWRCKPDSYGKSEYYLACSEPMVKR